MNKFKIGDTVKFSNDFLNTYTDIIARDMNIPSSVIEYVKKHYFNQHRPGLSSRRLRMIILSKLIA